jgi:lysyl-tRNA synthetase class II
MSLSRHEVTDVYWAQHLWTRIMCAVVELNVLLPIFIYLYHIKVSPLAHTTA